MPEQIPPAISASGDDRTIIRPVAGLSVLTPGTLLGHTYKIDALLARGGMGEVYRAKHVELGTEHAIKVILPSLAADPENVRRFVEEARKLGRVNNDAIVQYQGFFRDERELRYLVMEFVDGESLASIIAGRRLEPEEIVRLRDRLAQGLAAAHDKGITHRDISPENIIVPGGSVDKAKLIDFGIAKSGDPSDLTVIGTDFAGKYAFVSPEQAGLFGGQIDHRSDIYSLGLVLAAAAIGFGKRLDMGSSPSAITAARRHVPDLSAIPATLRPLIAPLLEPRPQDRPASMRAVLEMRYVPPREQRQPGTREPGRMRIWLAVGGLAALAVLAGIVFVLWPPRPVEEINAEFQAAIIGRQCSELTSSVTPDRVASVFGYAATPDDISSLRKAVEGIRGVAKLRFEVTLRVWPHCEVAALLKPLIGEGARNQATLALGSPGGKAYIGAPLVLDARSPAFDSYVYVDYFPAGEDVLHLLPNDKDFNNRRPIANRFVLGRWPMMRCWTLSGETGQQLVTLVASSRPLFAAPRPEVEKARDYLAALSQALGSNHQDRRDAAMAFFDLEAAGPGAASTAPGCPPG